MPQYPFARVDDPSVTQDFFHHMDDAPRIGGVVTVDGVKWKRLASKPQASIDTRVDCYSAKDYLKATGKSGDTVGALWDRSKEMSLKRKDKDGVDTVRQTFYDRYSKRRKGAKHPEQRREEAAKGLATKGIKIDWGTDD